MSKEVLNRILEGKIIAIVRGIPSDEVVGLAKALLAGGISCIEVTFDQSSKEKAEDTLKAIANIRQALGDQVCVGAGTVMTVEQVEAAAAAGAEYMISPNIKAAVIARTTELDKISIPGAMTVSEIVAANHAGADAVKLFPASTLGVDFIPQVRAPLPHIRLLAVSGVGLADIPAYLQAGAAGFGIGGAIANRKLCEEGAIDTIRENAARFAAACRVPEECR